MKKKISLSMAVALVLLAMTVTFSITMIVAMRIFDNTVRSVKEKEAMYNKIAEIDQISRENYYNEIDNTYLLDMLGTGYVAGLGSRDSRYYSAKQLSELVARTEGRITGIGVEVVKDTSGYAKITRVYENSPAQEAGIEKNYYITSIDGTDLKGITIENIRILLQGEVSTGVNISTLYNNEEKNIDLLRKMYEVPTVSYSLEGEIGYVKVTTFTDKTPSEFDYALRQLMAQGAKGFVFDLRNNTSTSLDNAARALDVLCPAGPMISAVYKDGAEAVLYTSNDGAIELPSVVLVNKSTASAAEMFTVVLRDIGNAKVVGEKTVGKGTLQKLFSLTDGSALELTIATLKPPISAEYNLVGIAPDYEISLKPEQEAIYYDLSITEDTQIQRAFEVVSAIVKNTEVPDETIDQPDVDETEPNSSEEEADSVEE